MMQGTHEYPIAHIPTDAEWSENFALEAGWPDTGLAVFYSTGRWYHDPHLWRETLMVALPLGEVAYYRGYGRNADRKVAGGLCRYEILEPGRRARLSFDGPMVVAGLMDLLTEGARSDPPGHARLQLDFEGRAPMWNMRGDSDAAAAMAGSLHIDQIGACTGSITVNGQDWRVSEGYAVRDHSQGVRNLAHYAGHNYLNGIFPDGRAFYCYAMMGPDGGLTMCNAVALDGERILPAEIRATEFLRNVTRPREPHELVLVSELGEWRIRFGCAWATMPCGMMKPNDTCAGRPHSHVAGMTHDEPCILVLDGMEGLGWSERGVAKLD